MFGGGDAVLLNSKYSDQTYLEDFEMYLWRRLEKISLTDRVRNEDVLQRLNDERNILYTLKRRKANWIGHIVRRNHLLELVIVEISKYGLK